MSCLSFPFFFFFSLFFSCCSLLWIFCLGENPKRGHWRRKASCYFSDSKSALLLYFVSLTFSFLLFIPKGDWYHRHMRRNRLFFFFPFLYFSAQAERRIGVLGRCISRGGLLGIMAIDSRYNQCQIFVTWYHVMTLRMNGIDQ